MRYFKMCIFTGDGEYETHEKLIDEPTFRKLQKAMVDGVEYLILEDRVIKRKMIKEILPADDIVSEYKKSGIPLMQFGLKEDLKLPAETDLRINEGLKKLGKESLKKYEP